MPTTTINYNLSPVLSRDTFTYIRKVKLPVGVIKPDFVCNEEPPCPEPGSAKVYAIAGNIIPFQFFFEDLVNQDPTNPTIGWKRSLTFFLSASILGDDDNTYNASEVVDNIADFFSVNYANNQSFQNLFLDVDKVISILPSSINCFWLKVGVCSTLNGCVSTTDYCYLGPFHIIRANEADSLCNRSVCIEGIYKKYDCQGAFYGIPEGNVGNYGQYGAQLCVEGEAETIRFDAESEENENGNITEVEKRKVIRLRFNGMNEELATQIANILQAPTVLVNGEAFKPAESIAKNNDKGPLWYIETELVSLFTCTASGSSSIDCD